MSSKMARWSKIAAKSSDNESSVNENKRAVLAELATANVGESNQQKDDSSLISENNNSTVGVDSKSMNNTPIDGVNTDNDQEVSLAAKVSHNVRSKVQNKVTKDMTHKKTSILLSLTNLAKLENFDKAHGGRVKGEFINNLLEEAFAELEKDPQWKEILNANLEEKISELAKRR
jgi:hypothetical protein